MLRTTLASLRHRAMRLALSCLAITAGVGFVAATLILGASAQSPAPLTLAQAEVLGLQNHPRILAADLLDRADEAVVGEARAAYLPTIGAATPSVA